MLTAGTSLGAPFAQSHLYTKHVSRPKFLSSAAEDADDADHSISSIQDHGEVVTMRLTRRQSSVVENETK